MHSTLQQEIASRQLAQRLRTENSPAFIEQALNTGNESARVCLLDNPNLSKEQWERLSKDPSVDVRMRVAKHKHIPKEFLINLYYDTDEDVRVGAFTNPLTEFSVYKDAVMNEKFSSYSKMILSWELRVVEDVEVFEFLWTTTKNLHTDLIRTLGKAYYMEYPNIDPECVRLINDEIRHGKPSATLREAYASNPNIATPEMLDRLKDDTSRPVVNAVAGNSSAWVSTHDYLAGHHKTPAIRISIARVTNNNELLNKIYHGTKSKDIRERVEKNPAFIDTQQ